MQIFTEKFKHYRVRDMRERSKHEYHYFDTLDEAEQKAVELMGECDFEWRRAEWNDNQYEYCQHPAIASCRVYVRVDGVNDIERCVCGKPGKIEHRYGLWCGDPECPGTHEER